jgi:pectinesterase
MRFQKLINTNQTVFKNTIELLLVILLSMMYWSSSFARENADVIVAQDGSGDFTTIQAAINAAPVNGTRHFVILIKKGIYNEKLFIEKNFIALVGEDQDSTVIVTAELRDIWRETHADDWGVATINIQNDVSDLILTNLTAKNNFADLNPDYPGKNGHTMTIRGGGNRVVIINCNILSTGGDTCSLWGQGYYYHKDCYFEGYVDYVCPRGWCYITDCDFFGHNTGASLWLDGRDDPDKKLVVRNSHFDGVKNFGLGRFHQDSQFYLLDCTLSENVNNNGGIIYVGSEGLKWGYRVYYYNTHRETSDYDWHQDNLRQAVNHPTPDDITAYWTFQNKWNPEESILAVLPFAALPKPGNGAVKVDISPRLRWIPGRNALSHNVYFGSSDPPAFQGNQPEAVFEPGTLLPDTHYYWWVGEVTEEGEVAGHVWQFRTVTDRLPEKATNPFPPDKAMDIAPPVEKLTWDMDVLVADTAKVYMGTSADSLKLVHVYTVAGYDPGPLTIGTTYYWRVDLVNKVGTTRGDLWQFTLEKSGYGKADYLQDAGSDGIISIEAEDYSNNAPVDDHYWAFVTEPDGHSGTGVMQALPDDGTYLLYNYSEKSPRLDYAVNFVKTGPHYVWIRAISQNDDDNVFHVGFNGQEERTAAKVGNFHSQDEWQWLNDDSSPLENVRSFEVKALGVQSVNLWYGEDGAIVDKIVLTVNPEYVPEGFGPQSTATGVRSAAQDAAPVDSNLNQNYPNPFNGETTLRYSLANDGLVSLVVYDILGREVATLVHAVQKVGHHSVDWNVEKSDLPSLASGVYFAMLKAGAFRKSVKLLYIK